MEGQSENNVITRTKVKLAGQEQAVSTKEKRSKTMLDFQAWNTKQSLKIPGKWTGVQD